MRDQYPKKVRPQVHLNDGGRAFYLVRITVESNGLKVVKRWIKSDTALEQMFEV